MFLLFSGLFQLRFAFAKISDKILHSKLHTWDMKYLESHLGNTQVAR